MLSSHLCAGLSLPSCQAFMLVGRRRFGLFFRLFPDFFYRLLNTGIAPHRPSSHRGNVGSNLDQSQIEVAPLAIHVKARSLHLMDLLSPSG